MAPPDEGRQKIELKIELKICLETHPETQMSDKPNQRAVAR